MEPNAPPLTGEAAPAAPPLTVGALVVQNGRFAGARRPLSASLGLIGRSPGCDIRLNVEDVNPLHCAILQTPGGLVLRDLDSGTGTFVNGQRVTTCLLVDGDTITVGPFEFRVSWQAPAGTAPLPEPVSRQAEAEALRVQAAAVAAQQAALFEEENRLQQRRAALEKQEEQLAAHLEERKRGLDAAQENVRREQAQLHRERAEFEQERRSRMEETVRDREQAARELHQAQRERQRLTELRRRLRRRWKRHWASQEQDLRRREQEVAREGERFLVERRALFQARLRFNGEAELGKRQIQDGWSELNRAQYEWQAARRAAEAELARKRQELSEGLAALSAAQRVLGVQNAQARAARTALEKEAQGLENRVRNLRNKLAEHEKELARKQGRSDLALAPMALLVPPVSLSTPANGDTALSSPEAEQEQCLSRLEALAGDLADQRLRLAEQWERLLLTQQDWQAEYTGFFPRLEEATHQLDQRERNLVEQERELAAAVVALREQQEDLTRQRERVEAWQAQRTAAESAWRSERAALVVQVETAEALAAKRQEQLDSLRNRWVQRRKEEFDRLSRELKRCRQTQRHYAELCQEYERRWGELGQQQRALAKRKLALEQFQLELVGRSENSAAAEKKIAKLRRQLATLHAEAERRLAERRHGLEVEADRLRAQGHHLNQRAEAAVERESALSVRQTEWEHHQAVAQREQERQQQELFRVRRQGDITAHQRDELKDELDRLIRLLLEEAEPLPPSVLAA